MSDFLNEEDYIMTRKSEPVNKPALTKRKQVKDNPVYTEYNFQGEAIKKGNKAGEKALAKVLTNGDYKKYFVLGKNFKPVDIYALDFRMDDIDRMNSNIGMKYYDFIAVSEKVFNAYLEYVKTRRRGIFDGLANGAL